MGLWNSVRCVVLVPCCGQDGDNAQVPQLPIDTCRYNTFCYFISGYAEVVNAGKSKTSEDQAGLKDGYSICSANILWSFSSLSMNKIVVVITKRKFIEV